MALRIGIDLDGVVADFNLGWTRAWNEQEGTTLTPADVDGWDVLPTLTELPSMREFWDWAADLGDGRSLFRDLPTFEGSLDAVHALVAAGHHPVVLTAKPHWAVHDTFAWLADVRFPTTEVHIIEDKWQVACDVYIDDAPHVLEDYARYRPDAEVLRFVRAWNDDVPGTVAVHGWDDVLDHLGVTARAH